MNYYDFLESSFGKGFHKAPVFLQCAVVYFIATVLFFFNINSVRDDFKKSTGSVLSGKNKPWVIIAYRSYLSVFRNFIDLGILMHKPDDYVRRRFNGKIDIENAHLLEEAMKSGRGIFIVSAHFALFHLAFFANASEINSVTIIRRFDSEGRVDLFEKLSRITQKDIDSVFIGPSSGLKVLKKLKRRGICACMFDYYYEDTGVIVSPFLGSDAAAPVGVTMIAEKANAILLPCIVLKKKDRYKLIFGNVVNNKNDVSPHDDAASLSEEQLHNNLLNYTAKLNAFFERYILTFPEQWTFWRSLPKRWAIASYLNDLGDSDG